MIPEGRGGMPETQCGRAIRTLAATFYCTLDKTPWPHAHAYSLDDPTVDAINAALGAEQRLSLTEQNATYWIEQSRKTDNVDEATIYAEQAVNAWRNAAYALKAELDRKAAPAAEPQLIQHRYEDRMIYPQTGPAVLADHCGHIVNARLNASTAGPEYCNRPRHEHVTP